MAIDTSYSEIELENALIDEFGVKYSRDGKRLLKGCPLDSYRVKEGTEIICDRAFQSFDIKTIKLPESLLAIGVCAFANNEVITEITIPSKVVFLANNNPFGGCFNLISVHLETKDFILDKNLIYSSDYKILYTSLFNYNSDTTIIINENTEEIAANCFWGQKDIFAIKVPKSVRKIGKAAFCKTSINCLDLKAQIDEIPEDFIKFSICGNLVLPPTVKIIRKFAFFDSTFNDLTLNESIEYIEERAFNIVKGLKSVNLCSVKTIEQYAFSECQDLKSIRVFGKIETIEKMAIANCENLEEINLSGSVRILKDNAICNCIKLKKVQINGPLNCVGVGNFWGCDNLDEISVPSAVFFKCYNAIRKYKPEIGYIIYDNKYSIKQDNPLFSVCTNLDESFKIHYEDDAAIQLEIMKPHLISFSKEIRKIGWFKREIHRNYLVSGRAAYIHTKYINHLKTEALYHSCICALNDLSMAYYEYENNIVHAEAALLIVVMLIEYFSILKSLILDCLRDLNIEENENNAEVFIAYITEYLFRKCVEVDQENKKFIPLFEDRKDLEKNYAFSIRYKFIDNVFLNNPDFFEDEEFEETFVRNYTLLMTKISRVCLQMCDADYNDFLELPSFVKKYYINENNYFIR